MSTLKDFTSQITQPLPGEIESGLVNQGTPTGFLPVDGAVYAQVTYPALYNTIGLVANGNMLTTWTSTQVGGNNVNNVIIYAGGKYILGGASTLKYSTNGTTWTNCITPPVTNIFGIAYGNGIYVAVGDTSISGMGTSTDGITWTTYTNAFNTIASLTYGNGLFVGVGNTGSIKTTTDGITWTARTSGTTSNFTGIIYGAGKYVAVGQVGTIRTSTDAVKWVAATSGTTSDLNGVTYGGGYFLAVGQNGIAFTSTNATTWSSVNVGLASTLNTAAYDGTFYVVAGNTGLISVSRNLSLWDVAAASSTSNLFTMTTNGSSTNPLFYAAGTNGAVATASPYTYDPTISFAVPTTNVTLTGLDLFIAI